MKTIKPQNSKIAKLLSASYSKRELESIEDLLDQWQTLKIDQRPNGTFAASTGAAKYTGYDNVWTRDTVHIANGFLELGQAEVAVKAVKALINFYQKYIYRFNNIINCPLLKDDARKRPHIRFDGVNMLENREFWNHKENDSIGYFLWLSIKLADQKLIDLDNYWALFESTILYLQAIEYYQDEDAGHWEEGSEIRVSSLGPCLAGLELFKKYIQGNKRFNRLQSVADELIIQGHTALNKILPNEFEGRETDSALLFLIYPLNIVGISTSQQILENHLGLEDVYGTKRYSGDSHWCAAYKIIQAQDQRYAITDEETLATRDKLLVPSQEAQWCIFDPIKSVIYGQKYLATHDPKDLKMQIYYFNRSLSLLTSAYQSKVDGFKIPEGQIPESYYIEDRQTGEYVPNDITPLAWAQINLAQALHYIKKSVSK